MAQDRLTFRRLALLRLSEAEILLASGHPSGAYYLAGYAIELALKARIAREFQADVIPDLKRVQNVHSHDLSALFGLASLKDELDRERDANPVLYSHWTTIKQWSEKARYEVWSDERASDMVLAVGGDEGLLKWLQNRW